MIQCCHIVLCQEILDQNLPVCWSIVVLEKPAVGSPFFGAFPSNRIPKATKGVTVRFLLPVAIPVNYTSEFREIFEATTYIGCKRIIYVALEFCMSFENAKYTVEIISNRLSDHAVICLSLKH
jgi:hypothetical protein